MALLLRYRHLVPRHNNVVVVWQPPVAPDPAQLPGLAVLQERGIIPGYAVRPPRVSFWRKWVDAVKRGTMRALCCGGVADDWDREIAFKRDVRSEMMRHVGVTPHTTVEEEVCQSVLDTNRNEVKHVPRLVAQVVVALRMKLGMGAMDRSVPGNVAVVRAEAAKMMREWNVRTKDAAAHLLEVERCFFEDDTHYRVSTWRARACQRSRFLRWFLGQNPGTSFDY